MTDVPGQYSPSRRAGLPIAEGELDAGLKRALYRTSLMRQLFYVVVLLVALAGQVSGAVEALGIPLVWAIPAVGALELGGVVVLANADVRRRLGERAVASRVLSALIAAFAVAFNWMAHSNKLLGGFFAGMSALGYLVWLMHTENQRRDRLRSKGDLPPTTPAYEVVGHWLRHPWLTLRAKNLAKANPGLGLYDSIVAARSEVRRERRTSAIAKVLHRKIRAAVDPTTADIAVAVYDLDEIAVRLANGADYDGLTAIIAADLAPARLAVDPPALRRGRRKQLPLHATATVETGEPAATPTPTPTLVEPVPDRQLTLPEFARTAVERRVPVTLSTPVTSSTVLPAVFRELEDVLPRSRASAARQSVPEPAEESVPVPVERPKPAVRESSLRSRVHQALDAHVPDGDGRDVNTLVTFVGELLQLNDVDRLTASTYVRTWKKEADAGRRESVNGRHLTATPGLPG